MPGTPSPILHFLGLQRHRAVLLGDVVEIGNVIFVKDAERTVVAEANERLERPMLIRGINTLDGMLELSDVRFWETVQADFFVLVNVEPIRPLEIKEGRVIFGKILDAIIQIVPDANDIMDSLRCADDPFAPEPPKHVQVKFVHLGKLLCEYLLESMIEEQVREHWARHVQPDPATL